MLKGLPMTAMSSHRNWTRYTLAWGLIAVLAL
jgi:hypothetical protein